jgi:hypothetical protein
MHRQERVSIFMFPLSSDALCFPRMHELLEAILAMHSAYPSAFLHLACVVGVSLRVCLVFTD